MSDIVTRYGHKFRVTMEHDDLMGAPWKEHDGHGSVTQWARRDKKPGERVLAYDRGAYRFYDVQEAIQTAKRDGWGLSNENEAELAQRLGRKPTAKEIRAEAVERDFQYLRAWCNDEWEWVTIDVVLLDKSGEDTEYARSVGGIDGYGKYADECAGEIMDELLHDLTEDKRKKREAAKKEKAERAFWANMDLATI